LFIIILEFKTGLKRARKLNIVLIDFQTFIFVAVAAAVVAEEFNFERLFFSEKSYLKMPNSQAAHFWDSSLLKCQHLRSYYLKFFKYLKKYTH